MQPYNINSNSPWTQNKPSWTQRVVPLLFVISVSMNVYFLFFTDAPSPAELSQAQAQSVTLPEMETVLSAAPKIQTVSLNPEQKPELSTVSESVKQSSFFSPQHFQGQEVKTLDFKISGSLNRTLCGILPQEECKPLSAHIARILMWSLDVNTNIRKGDRMELAYQPLASPSEFKILRLRYHSQYLKRDIEANFYKGPKMKYGGYFDADGKAIDKRLVKATSPIRDYSEITSLPGDFRKGLHSGHSGTDFKAEVGTPVHAPFEGRVTRVNWNRRHNGFCVELDHPGQGIKTLYLHLDRVRVKPRSYVKQGQVIGLSGNTGRSFAPHLHYEIRKRTHKGTIYNPFKFKHHKSRYSRIGDTQAYQKTVQLYDSILQNNLS